MLALEGSNANDVFRLIENNVQINGNPFAYAAHGQGNDLISAGGGKDSIFTGSGNDILDGGDENDDLSGGGGDDMIDGGAGDDRVFADAGNDMYRGGTGNDTLDFTYLHLNTPEFTNDVEAGVKVDLAIGIAQHPEYGTDQFAEFENIVGTPQSDTLLGSAADNWLIGAKGDDTLDGRAGTDKLEGGDGKDTLIGGLGNDVFDLGIDLGMGQWGADTPSDTIRYFKLTDSGDKAATCDQIFYFVPGTDKIDLRAIDANPALKGNQNFKLVPRLTSTYGEVRLRHVGADTFVDVDGDRDTKVDMVIKVVGAHLGKADFIL